MGPIETLVAVIVVGIGRYARRQEAVAWVRMTDPRPAGQAIVWAACTQVRPVNDDEVMVQFGKTFATHHGAFLAGQDYDFAVDDVYRDPDAVAAMIAQDQGTVIPAPPAPVAARPGRSTWADQLAADDPHGPWCRCEICEEARDATRME